MVNQEIDTEKKTRKKRKKKFKKLKKTVIFLWIGILSLLGGLAALTAFLNEADVWCEIIENLSWCPKPISSESVTVPKPSIPPKSPKPPSVIELATELLTGNNPAGLQIEILPSTTLKVGKAMKMRLRSDYEGFLIVFDITHAGEFITLFPNEYSDQRQQGHLKVGQSLVIPDTYYGFDFEVQKPGQGILVAILVENGLTVVREVLPVPFVASSESSTRDILQRIRQRLDRTIRSDSGVEKSIRWSGIKIEYEIIAANGTIQK